MTRTAQHRPAALTIGSLFTGMGGLDLAVEAVLDARTVWVSEIDPAASRILAKRFPDAPNLGDLTAIDWDTVPRVDVITGGSPCQDLSTAGRRAGMTDGTRSNLWVAMRDAIAALRPTYVVWENVRGALSATAASSLEPCPGCMGDSRHRGPVLRALGRVLGDLADLGFDAEWHGLRVSDLGGCHGRWRVFVMAWPADSDLTGLQGLAGTEGASPAQPVAGAGGPDLTLLPTPAAANPNDGESVETWEARRQRTKERVGNGNGFGTPLSIAVQLLPTPAANLGSNGGPQHPDRRRAGGHSVSIEDAVHGLALLPTPRVENNENRQSEGYGGLLSGAVSWGDYAAAIASHERLTGRPAPDPTEPGANGRPRLSPAFVEFMMCLPEGWVTDVPGITRNEALKALGNGVVPIQAAHALRLMLNRTRAAA